MPANASWTPLWSVFEGEHGQGEARPTGDMRAFIAFTVILLFVVYQRVGQNAAGRVMTVSQSTREFLWVVLVFGGALLTLLVAAVVWSIEQDKAKEQMTRTRYTLKATKAEVILGILFICLFGGLVVFASCLKLEIDHVGVGVFLWIKVLPIILGSTMSVLGIIYVIYSLKWKAEIQGDHMTLSLPFKPTEEIPFSDISCVQTNLYQSIVYVNGEKKFSIDRVTAGRDFFLARMEELGKTETSQMTRRLRQGETINFKTPMVVIILYTICLLLCFALQIGVMVAFTNDLSAGGWALEIAVFGSFILWMAFETIYAFKWRLIITSDELRIRKMGAEKVIPINTISRISSRLSLSGSGRPGNKLSRYIIIYSNEGQVAKTRIPQKDYDVISSYLKELNIIFIE